VHAFDYAVAFRWGDLELICVQEYVNAVANTYNSIMYVHNVVSGVWDIPTNPKWRDRLQVAAQIAGILACIAALNVAAITISNYRNSQGHTDPTHVPSPPALQSSQ
jgi:hypothetical protein